jgi:hypothetical protein
MKEHPILFSGPMIRAILAGQKTVTRRAVKLREFGPSDTPGYHWRFRDKRMLWNDVHDGRILELCPHGRSGDLLWVRETLSRIDETYCWKYAADKAMVMAAVGSNQRKVVPTIHMPRAASRITLEIECVTVERLHDITETDAIAEGAEEGVSLSGLTTAQCIRLADMNGAYWANMAKDSSVNRHRLGFAWLWESINGPKTWDENPWVWRIQFKRIAQQTTSEGARHA